MYNISLREGVVPPSLKHAIVFPLPKQMPPKSVGSDGFESLDYVVNKAAEISIRMFSFFSLFFVISAGFLPREPLYCLCRFRYRRTVNKTACSILWHSLSKFVLSLGSGLSRHPEGLSFSGLSFRDTQRV